MLVAAMLAMVLAVAAPALAQGDIGDVNEGDDQFNVGDETVYSAVCQNILGAFDAAAAQDATAAASATAGDNAVAVAEIAQEQNVSVEQANECLNAFFASASATTAAHVQYGGGGGGGGDSASASATALPATGGMVPSSVLALGAGALLVGGGLLARRIVR
jgi:LPXTG-motif cell wall-anchored protein